MIVKVTKQDIKEGMRNIHSSCPVALAIKRATGVDYVSVGDVVFLGEDIVRVSRAVDRFVTRFDDKKPVKPFNFRLTLPK